MKELKQKNLKDFFDEKYYDDGIASGKSCYVNYRWIPELTIPMAYFMMRALGIEPGHTVLDYGCAKGYLVKALRLLKVNAFGVDVSEYAIENVDGDVKKYCRRVSDSNPVPFDQNFDYVISKDVLEHMPQESIDAFLINYSKITDKMFHLIPLGDRGQYRIPEYHLDKSHLQIQDEAWWLALFKKHGWNLVSLEYHIPGVKENWHERHPKGNAFFNLSKRREEQNANVIGS